VFNYNKIEEKKIVIGAEYLIKQENKGQPILFRLSFIDILFF